MSFSYRAIPWPAILAVAVLAAAACGGGAASPSASKDATTGQATPAAKSETKSAGAPSGSPVPAAKATVVANPSGNQSGKPLLLADSFSNSGQYPYYVAIAKVVNENAKSLNVTVVETGGAVENIRRFSRKELDFGLASVDSLRGAYEGEGEWQGKAQKQMRFMWVYGVAPNIFWVTEASGVKTFADLEGKAFSPGSRGSNTEVLTEKALTILGVKPNYFRGAIEDALNAVRDRRVIGWAKTASGPKTPDPTTLEVGSTQPIRPLVWSKEDQAKIQAADPNYRFVEIPAGVYKEHPEPFETFASFSGVGATSDLSQQDGYLITKAIMEHPTDLEVAFPAVKEVDQIPATLQNASIPLHAGVVQYLKEKGHEVPAHLIPPEYKP